MGVRYDAAQLQKIISDLAIITNLDITVLDRDFNRIAVFNHGWGFCSTIQNAETGGIRCACSDTELLKKCQLSKQPEIHICHAGLVDMAVPVVKGSSVLGYILLGRIRTSEGFDTIYPRIRWVEADYDSMRQDYLNLVCYNDAQITSTVNVVTTITSFILLNHMMKEEFSLETTRIVHYIDGHLGEKLTVDTLCRALHLSRNSLYEHIHASFHCTVSEYITLRRIERAKELLSGTELSIGEIADQCGFGSDTYFFKLMKKHEKMTPRQFRQQFR